MLKAFKTELSPTAAQAEKIRRTVGVCRNVYNMFIHVNQERHAANLPFMSGYDFSKWLNNDYLSANPDKRWLKEVSSKAVKQAIMHADAAFKSFFKHKTGYPKFKKKGRTNPGAYLPNGNYDAKRPLIQIERHRIKLPTFGWIRLKEKGYIPYNLPARSIKNATVSYKAGRYYVSVVADVEPAESITSFANGIGIDLGVKDLAIVSTGKKCCNINKTRRIRQLKKRLKRAAQTFKKI